MSRMLGAALVVGLLAIPVLATPAAAHTRLTGTEPRADSSVTDEFEVVVLHFSDAVDQTIAELQIVAPDGSAVAEGPARIDGARVEQPVGALPATGTYAVSYEVVASDGHPLTGEFAFDYDGPVAEPEPEPTEEVAEAPTDVPTDEPEPNRTQEPAGTPTPGDRALAGASRGGAAPPAGLLALTAAVLLAVLAAAGYAIRAVVRWQPQS